MKTKVAIASALMVALVMGFGLYITAGDVSAQPVKRVAPAVKVPPQVRELCTKADLRAWENYTLGPKDEFPYSGQCKSCWEQAGVMNLPTMSVWIINNGAADAPASKAKLRWRTVPNRGQYRETRVTPIKTSIGLRYWANINPTFHSSDG